MTRNAPSTIGNANARAEKGFPDKDGDNSDSTPGNNLDQNDEYANLVRYISTYRDGRRKSTASELGYDTPGKKKPWWKFWAKARKDGSGDATFEVPDDWLDTELRQGLATADVENRRKKTGWNELTTEKENMCVDGPRGSHPMADGPLGSSSFSATSPVRSFTVRRALSSSRPSLPDADGK